MNGYCFKRSSLSINIRKEKVELYNLNVWMKSYKLGLGLSTKGPDVDSGSASRKESVYRCKGMACVKYEEGEALESKLLYL